MNHSLKTFGLLGVAAFLVTGCNGLNIDDGSGDDDGGTAGNCLASFTQGSTKLALDSTNVPMGTGVPQAAEVFVINGSPRAVSKVTLMLDQVSPPNTNLSSAITVGIYSDELISTNGAQTSPTQPTGSPYVDPTTGVVAISTSVSAASISTTRGAQWYDFCFNGASGNGCSGAGGQVTFNAGQIYWIVISGAPSAGTTSYLDWYGTGAGSNYSAGEIFSNASGFAPVNSSSVFNFAFKLGC